MHRSLGAALLVASCALAACASGDSATRPVVAARADELCFAVLSDIHIAHRWRDGPVISVDRERGAETFEWLARALHEAQSLPALNFATPAPQFALVCGDLTEFGAIDDTWSAVERLLDSLALPWFAAAGERDLGWSPIFEGFEKRFGGLAYSFDRAGAHFIALCSASPCELRPSFSPLQLNWLRADLAKNADRKPVFIFMHHAPDSPELAPSQVLELRAALDGHDIAAAFFGHGQRVEYRRVAGLDCEQSGSTFAGDSSGSADARGYAIASVADGKLRVAYRYFDPAREPRLLLEKSLRQRVRAALEIEAPAPGAPAREQELSIVVRSPDDASVFLLLDGEKRTLDWRFEQARWRAKLPLVGLAGGAHQLAVGCDDEGTPRLCTRIFLAPSEQVLVRWRRNFEGALCAAPVLAGNSLALASSAGEVVALDPASGELRWSARSAAVIGSPWACADGGLVIGTTTGWIEAYDSTGSLRWRYQLGHPVLAGLAGNGEWIFAADAAGVVHALELATGARRWKFEGAHGPVLAQPRVDGGSLTFSAWDGLWALDLRTGELAEPTPALEFASRNTGSRLRVPRGRERVSSAEASGRIAEVSELGLVSLRDGGDGSVLWSWRATPESYVFAAPLLAGDGTVWVAAMDGSLSCVCAR